MIKDRAIAFQGRIALGEFPSGHEFVEWAIDALIAGFDSPSLVILAGLTHLDDDDEIRSFWIRSLTELNICIPESTESRVSLYAQQICNRILSGEISIIVGHQILYNIWVETALKYSWGGDYQVWVSLQDSLELVEDGYDIDIWLPQLKGLNRQTYESFVRQEAINFLASQT